MGMANADKATSGSKSEFPAILPEPPIVRIMAYVFYSSQCRTCYGTLSIFDFSFFVHGNPSSTFNASSSPFIMFVSTRSIDKTVPLAVIFFYLLNSFSHKPHFDFLFPFEKMLPKNLHMPQKLMVWIFMMNLHNRIKVLPIFCKIIVLFTPHSPALKKAIPFILIHKQLFYFSLAFSISM